MTISIGMPLTEKDFEEIEDVINADVVDDAEEWIEAYFDEVPVLIAEIRRCWKLLDENGIER